MITLKVSEPVVGVRNVISILFQQHHDISKTWCEGFTFKVCINNSASGGSGGGGGAELNKKWMC